MNDGKIFCTSMEDTLTNQYYRITTKKLLASKAWKYICSDSRNRGRNMTSKRSQVITAGIINIKQIGIVSRGREEMRVLKSPSHYGISSLIKGNHPGKNMV